MRPAEGRVRAARKFVVSPTAEAGDLEAGPISRHGRVVWATAAGRNRGWAEPASQDQQAPTRRTDAVARRLADQRAAKTLPIVRELQASGIGTLQGMADALNARGVPTARGAQWYPTTVKNLLERDLRDLQQAAA